MMINKRLIGTVKESKKYIAGNVICQWISLAANITMMGAIARMLQSLFSRSAGDGQIVLTAVIAAGAVIIRFICAVVSSRMGYFSSKAVKEHGIILHKISFREFYHGCFKAARGKNFPENPKRD